MRWPEVAAPVGGAYKALMRVIVISLFCLLAAGCEGAAEPTSLPAQGRLLSGQYAAMSDATRRATGELSIQRGGLIFENGVVLYTRTLEARGVQDRIARDGLSYAALVSGRADAGIELRRITEAVSPHGGASLCGDQRPSYAALAGDQRGQHVTVLLFSGEEPPGPEATHSTLCATLNYARAGLPQGVVL